MSDTVTTAPTPYDYGLDGFWLDEELKDDYKGLPTADGAPASITLSNGLVLTQFNGERYQDQFGDLWDLIFWDYPEYYTFVIGTPKDYSIATFEYVLGYADYEEIIEYSTTYPDKHPTEQPSTYITQFDITLDSWKYFKFITTYSNGKTTTTYNPTYFYKAYESEPETYSDILCNLGASSSAGGIYFKYGGTVKTSVTMEPLSSFSEGLTIILDNTATNKYCYIGMSILLPMESPPTGDTNSTLTVKDPITDNTLGSITLASDTYKATLTTAGLTRTLTLTNSSEEVQTLQWSNSAPAGKVINAIGNDDTVIKANSEQTVSISLDGVITFYEEYVDLPTSSTTTVLYKNTADPITVDKTNYLTFVAELSGTFRSDVDVVHPTIRVQIETPDFNYAYIASLKRYYYVTSVTYVANGLWEVELSCDVLMSYKDAIENCSAFVERNEYKVNPDIIDNKIVMKQGQTVTDTVVEPVDNILQYETSLDNQPSVFVLDVYCGYSI